MCERTFDRFHWKIIAQKQSTVVCCVDIGRIQLHYFTQFDFQGNTIIALLARLIYLV